jgi:hypothetical protein
MSFAAVFTVVFLLQSPPVDNKRTGTPSIGTFAMVGSSPQGRPHVFALAVAIVLAVAVAVAVAVAFLVVISEGDLLFVSILIRQPQKTGCPIHRALRWVVVEYNYLRPKYPGGVPLT